MAGVGSPVLRKHEEAMVLREKGRKRRGAGRKEAVRACGRWSPVASFAGAAGHEEEERSGAFASLGGASGIPRAGSWAEEAEASEAVASIQPGSSAGWLRESSRSGMRLRAGG